MNKIIIILCAVLAVAYGHNDVDNYIKFSYDQYERILTGYDEKLAYFKQDYIGRVEAIGVQKDFVVGNIVETQQRITPLLMLKDSTKACISQYRNYVENVEDIKDAFMLCEEKAFVHLDTMLASASKTRNALEKNMVDIFSKAVLKCDEDFADYPVNYTSCVTDVTTKANIFTHENQKTFEYEVEAAECLAKANVRRVSDCVHTIQVDVFTNLGQFEALTGRCYAENYECQPCLEYTCGEAISTHVYQDHETINNPFYGRNDYGRSDIPNCLMLQLE